MESGSQLSCRQTEILIQFQDITSIEDLDRCINILQSYDWNIESAIDAINFSPDQSQQQNALNGVDVIEENGRGNLHSGQNSSGEIRNQSVVSFFPGVLRLLTVPFEFPLRAIFSLIRFIWSFIRPQRSTASNGAISDVTTFINQFEQKYGQVHPTFFHGTYNEAINEARKDLKFLLVYLHSEHHQYTDEFCRTVLSTHTFVDFLHQKRVVFWAASVSSTQGYRASEALRESTYPFLGLIGLRYQRMVLVRRFEGRTSLDRLVSSLASSIEDNELHLHTARLERQERNMSQILREEQDRAYKESLKADQEKAKRKQEEQSKREREEQERNQREQDEQMKRENLIKMKIELADRVPVEPETTCPNTIRLSIKLPNGVRLERRFNKTSSIKDLYFFVFCHDQSPLQFEITTNFPRKVLPGKPPSLEDPMCKWSQLNENADGDWSFETCGLVKSELLYVRDLEA